MSSFTFCLRAGSTACSVNIRETPPPHQHLEANPLAGGRVQGAGVETHPQMCTLPKTSWGSQWGQR